jgi:hypothetical protein
VPVEEWVEHEGPDIDHRHHGIEVHEGMTVRQFDGDDLIGLAAGEQRLGHHFYGHRRRPLAHTDEYTCRVR